MHACMYVCMYVCERCGRGGRDDERQVFRLAIKKQ